MVDKKTRRVGMKKFIDFVNRRDKDIVELENFSNEISNSGLLESNKNAFLELINEKIRLYLSMDNENPKAIFAKIDEINERIYRKIISIKHDNKSNLNSLQEYFYVYEKEQNLKYAYEFLKEKMNFKNLTIASFLFGAIMIVCKFVKNHKEPLFDIFKDLVLYGQFGLFFVFIFMLIPIIDLYVVTSMYKKYQNRINYNINEVLFWTYISTIIIYFVISFGAQEYTDIVFGVFFSFSFLFFILKDQKMLPDIFLVRHFLSGLVFVLMLLISYYMKHSAIIALVLLLLSTIYFLYQDSKRKNEIADLFIILMFHIFLSFLSVVIFALFLSFLKLDIFILLFISLFVMSILNLVIYLIFNNTFICHIDFVFKITIIFLTLFMFFISDTLLEIPNDINGKYK